MKYKIMGTSSCGTEEIDCDIDGMKEAKRLVAEYRMAYGSGWSFEIKKDRGE